MNALRPSVLVLAALALAGACGGEASKPSPEAAPSTPAPAATTPAAAPAKPKAAEAPVPAPTPAPTPPAAEPSPLRVVALREGPIELMRLGSEPAAVLEGEPLPIVAGVPARGPSGGRGLANLGGLGAMGSTLAIAGTLGATGTAWTSTEQEFDRAASWYWVHRNLNQGQGWEQVDLRKGLLIAHYAAYVERGGSLFGLIAWSRDPAQDEYDTEEESPRARAYFRALEAALGKTRPAFVHLEGPAAPAPVLPEGAQPRSAVTTSDGTLYALATERAEDETERVVLLVWPPGATESQRVELPEHQGSEARLDANGDLALVMGISEPPGGPATSYLATGRGTQWERIPVSLPGHPEKASPRILGAGQTPTGELWIAVSDYGLQAGDAPVWRRPAGGEWQPVPLPAFGDDLFGREPGTAYDLAGLEPDGWYAFERPPLDDRVVRQPRALAWADGAVWVVLELGPATAAEEDRPSMRQVLLTTRPGSAMPTLLPPPWELHVERHNVLHHGATPGKDACTRVAYLVGPASLAEKPEVLDAVRGAGTEAASIAHVHVGRLDDAEALVATANVSSPAEAKALQRALAKAAGTEPKLECRIPSLVRMVP